MKKYITNISICLLLVVCLSFTGCNWEDKGKNAFNPKASFTQNVQEEKIDFGGKTISIMYPGQLLEDYKLKRINDVIGTKYNCRIAWNLVSWEYYKKELLNDIMAGKCGSDIIYLNGNKPFSQIVEKGVLTALDEYINFEEDIFNNRLQDRSLWNGKHYGLCLVDRASLNFEQPMIGYNKEMLESNGLPDISELQQKGQWTWEKFEEITSKVTSDTDGDGITDIWGAVMPSGEYFLGRLILSNGSNLVKQDDTGRPVPNTEDPAVIEAVDFLYKLLNVHKSVLTDSVKLGDKVNTEVILTLVQQNRVAITIPKHFFLVQADSNLRMAFYPKGPRASDYSCILDAGQVYAIPSCVENKKEIAVILGEIVKLMDQEFNYIDEFKSAYKADDFSTVEQAIEKVSFVQHYMQDASAGYRMITEGIMKGQQNYEEILNEAAQIMQEHLDFGFNSNTM